MTNLANTIYTKHTLPGTLLEEQHCLTQSKVYINANLTIRNTMTNLINLTHHDDHLCDPFDKYGNYVFNPGKLSDEKANNPKVDPASNCDRIFASGSVSVGYNNGTNDMFKH